jgi:predicted Zn-dependent protease
MVHEAARLYDNRDSADALYGEAIMMRMSGRPQVAVALLGEALRKEPSHFGANLAMGRILVQRGHDEEALANFSVAFAARPRSALVAYELAVTELTLGQVLAAEQWAAKAYELDSNSFYWDFLTSVRNRAAQRPREN